MATGFIFGYVPGTEAERRYRLWYRTRYHHPADDVRKRVLVFSENQIGVGF